MVLYPRLILVARVFLVFLFLLYRLLLLVFLADLYFLPGVLPGCNRLRLARNTWNGKGTWRRVPSGSAARWWSVLALGHHGSMHELSATCPHWCAQRWTGSWRGAGGITIPTSHSPTRGCTGASWARAMTACNNIIASTRCEPLHGAASCIRLCFLGGPQPSEGMLPHSRLKNRAFKVSE